MINPKYSIIIAHVPHSENLNTQLDTCLASLPNALELVLVVNPGIGYGKSFNWGMRAARGEYLICVSNDTTLVSGNIEDLLIPGKMTTPTIIATGTMQFGAFFCISRTIYELLAGPDKQFFDEQFEGAYFEDDDIKMRLDQYHIPIERIPSVQISHIGGVTVQALGKEREYMDRNREIFRQKWGRDSSQ